MLVTRWFFFVLTFFIILSGCSHKAPKKIIHEKISSAKSQECDKHTKVMIHASTYIEEEFEKGYFLQKDVAGAKAQIFLIESKSPTVFAKNINAAQDSYIRQYQLAKQEGCDLKEFSKNPLTKVTSTIESLESVK